MVIDTKKDKAQAGVVVGDDEFVKELTDTEDVETSTEPVARVTTEDDNPVTVVKRPIYKRPAFLIVLVAFLLVVGIYGVRYYTYAASHESTDDAFIDGDIVQVSPKVSGHIIKLYVDSNQPVKEGELLAEIDPRDYQSSVDQAEAALNAAITRQQAARINIALTSKTSHAGVQQASSGVQLARQAVSTSTATVGNVQAKAAQARAQVVSAIANAEQAKAQVAAAQAEATRATADVARYEQLYGKDEVSQQQLDVARASAQTAVAGLEAARRRAAATEAQIAEAQANAAAAEQNVKVAESQVGESRARVGTAEGQLSAASAAPEQVASSEAQKTTADAEVERAQAALDQAKLSLSYTKIIAPQTGRIARKATEVGNYVQPGQALMAIVPDQVWVVANFKETQLTYMKPGQPVEVRIDAYPGKVFKGHVDSIQPGTGSRFSLLPPENASGNYVKVVQRVPVKILLDNSPETNALLAPGMSAVPEVKVT
jgi:membrane fusion protein (multidrug efflux system)